jgi:8-amino-7-oxononanoate synthase
MKFPQKLTNKILQRKENHAFRQLHSQNELVDFSSNDYLGFAVSKEIFTQTHDFLVEKKFIKNGATGSRLLTGNHPLYEITEKYVADFHQIASALLYNSGYDANVGFFSSVPQKGDFILYDEWCHASIRDGIVMSNAQSFKYKHNDFEDLERLIFRIKKNINSADAAIYIATESVFSMDGDSPDLPTLIKIAEENNCYIVIDEAHALGVLGEIGEGLVQSLHLQDKVFARIVTFGKGLGCHGAAILGSTQLRDYLINFSRSLIYSTGLSPHSVATILISYHNLEKGQKAIAAIKDIITFFNNQKNQLGLQSLFVPSFSAIQSAIIPGNEKVKSISKRMQEKGFDIKAILSPTVPEGGERLRICLHSYNTEEQILRVLQNLT